MQGFDFCTNLIKFYQVYPNFNQFIQTYPNSTQTCPNFAQIGLNLPKKFASSLLWGWASTTSGLLGLKDIPVVTRYRIGNRTKVLKRFDCYLTHYQLKTYPGKPKNYDFYLFIFYLEITLILWKKGGKFQWKPFLENTLYIWKYFEHSGRFFPHLIPQTVLLSYGHDGKCIIDKQRALLNLPPTSVQGKALLQ